MNQRDYAQDLATRTNNADDWNKFKKLRNKVVSRIRNEKSVWEQGQLDHMTNSFLQHP